MYETRELLRLREDDIERLSRANDALATRVEEQSRELTDLAASASDEGLSLETHVAALSGRNAALLSELAAMKAAPAPRSAAALPHPDPAGSRELQAELRAQIVARVDAENRASADALKLQAVSRSLAVRSSQLEAASADEHKAREAAASLTERLSALRARNDALERSGATLEAKAARSEDRAREASRLAVALRASEHRCKEGGSLLLAAQARLSGMEALEARLRERDAELAAATVQARQEHHTAPPNPLLHQLQQQLGVERAAHERQLSQVAALVAALEGEQAAVVTTLRELAGENAQLRDCVAQLQRAGNVVERAGAPTTASNVFTTEGLTGVAPTLHVAAAAVPPHQSGRQPDGGEHQPLSAVPITRDEGTPQSHASPVLLQPDRHAPAASTPLRALITPRASGVEVSPAIAAVEHAIYAASTTLLKLRVHRGQLGGGSEGRLAAGRPLEVDRSVLAPTPPVGELAAVSLLASATLASAYSTTLIPTPAANHTPPSALHSSSSLVPPVGDAVLYSPAPAMAKAAAAPPTCASAGAGVTPSPSPASVRRDVLRLLLLEEAHRAQQEQQQTEEQAAAQPTSVDWSSGGSTWEHGMAALAVDFAAAERLELEAALSAAACADAVEGSSVESQDGGRVAGSEEEREDADEAEEEEESSSGGGGLWARALAESLGVTAAPATAPAAGSEESLFFISSRSTPRRLQRHQEDPHTTASPLANGRDAAHLSPINDAAATITAAATATASAPTPAAAGYDAANVDAEDVADSGRIAPGVVVVEHSGGQPSASTRSPHPSGPPTRAPSPPAHHPVYDAATLDLLALLAQADRSGVLGVGGSSGDLAGGHPFGELGDGSGGGMGGAQSFPRGAHPHHAGGVQRGLPSGAAIVAALEYFGGRA